MFIVSNESMSSLCESFQKALQCAMSLAKLMWHKPEEMGSIRCLTLPGFPHLHIRHLSSITKTSTGLQEQMFVSADIQPIVSDI